MSKPQIRSSQLITTFGPGAMVDLPDDAVVIAGIESWRYHKGQPMPVISESRLQAKVGALLEVPDIGFRQPPAAVEDRGFTPDITGYRFPEWFIVQNVVKTSTGNRSRRLVHLNDLDRGKYRDVDGKRYPVVPVRFVRACRRGHVGDIDWHAFVHGAEHENTECKRELVIEERGTSGDLDSILIRCACGADRVMSQAARMDLTALGRCNGSRPWLGPGTREGCGEPSRLLIRSASNAYFPQLLSVISIPDAMDEVDRAVGALWESHLSAVESEDHLKLFSKTPVVKQQLDGMPLDKVMAAIRRRRAGGNADERPVKAVEFEALSEAKEELGRDKPEGDFFARSLPRDLWDAPWLTCLERVVLVHRLREVVAQLGFTRFEAAVPDIQGELDMQVQRAPIGLDISWVPATENRGEGVFLQFKSHAVKTWLEK